MRELGSIYFAEIVGTGLVEPVDGVADCRRHACVIWWWVGEGR
jgi:hypothetical protein